VFAECLERILIVGHRQLDSVLRIHVRHSNGTRPHRPARSMTSPATAFSATSTVPNSDWSPPTTNSDERLAIRGLLRRHL